jgi:hypothetical protein
MRWQWLHVTEDMGVAEGIPCSIQWKDRGRGPRSMRVVAELRAVELKLSHQFK